MYIYIYRINNTYNFIQKLLEKYSIAPIYKYVESNQKLLFCFSFFFNMDFEIVYFIFF